MINPLHEIPKDGLPTFALFKDLVLDDAWMDSTEVRSFEWVKTCQDRESLLREVPKPTLPADPALIELLRGSEYIELEVDRDTDEIDPEGLEFRLSRQQFLEPPTDAEIFGESYTLLWLCPPDREAIVSSLLRELERLSTPKRERVHEFMLYTLWKHYLDEMLVLPDGEADFELGMWVREELEKRIRNLPNAPEERDWDEFQRYL